LTDFADHFSVERMRSSNAEASLLREQFELLSASPRSVEVCEWIARCFYQLEQYDDAGNWYETTGQLILTENHSPAPLQALSALEQYERALDCYRRNDDGEAFEECSTMIRQLKKACASA
jgi:tetratricopeptide (TPR) repeat protein